MAHWFQDNVALVIGSAIGLAGCAVALLVYFWERKPKTLDYMVISHTPLLSRGAAGMEASLKIAYQGEPVKDPRLVLVRIKNTGKVAIEGQDFVVGPTIGFTKPVELLEVFQVDGSSENIVDEIALGWPGKVEVSPQLPLLNAREYFDLQMVLDGEPGEITVSARFKGQTRPMQQRDLRVVSFRQALRVVTSGNSPALEYGLLVAGLTSLVIAVVSIIGGLVSGK